jgi:hypothetical protein
MCRRARSVRVNCVSPNPLKLYLLSGYQV